MSWQAYLAVGIGSGLGSALRYGVSLVSLAAFGGHFPWATLLVNVLGSGIIGWIAATASRFPNGKLAHWQPLLVAGFCGGFTTFSLFSLETLHLIQQGLSGLALFYVLISLPLWLLAAWLGERIALARSSNR
ncbi:MAG: fluoride efflux transporter CrcB [Gammaproteobacteria bacterium]|jgi:CrcB protein|uniref:Fluoride-specific ion channel FluC n=1 Tax=Halomonas hydrothermalis TaxID=115561 RepID=A0A6F8U822_9GAMM|nr:MULTISPECIES: fluoride efflux transporter CrcB [Halomonas]MBR9926178.1 fluoride efflux transporter CrcB [Gammaproteobacteria bacterium]MDW0359600.1 fluoride efflux transporter CrcB [Halomonas venusta]BCB08969.1 putative fluoride ion transporter CrcB [Halomonas hydrothermalis]